MKKISKKEFLSFFQIIIVILCALCFYSLTISQRFPNDLQIFKAQCAYFTTGTVCLIFALATWFYNSSVHRTRVQLRVFKSLVLWVLLYFIFRYGQIGDKYAYTSILKFEASIWDETQRTHLFYINIMCYIVIILMFFMNSLMISMVAISLTHLWTNRERHE